MAKEYKTLVFPDTIKGRTTMAEEIDKFANDGWELKDKEVSDQGWSGGKTFVLGAVFLPLALLGKKDKVITLIMERERKVGSE